MNATEELKRFHKMDVFNSSTAAGRIVYLLSKKMKFN